MAHISIERQHQLPLEKARNLVQQAADELKRDVGLDYRWSGDALHFDRPGVSGQFLVSDKRVKVEVKLGMLLSGLKGKIEQELTRYLDQHLK
ncbi:polyhydroxyalkanoic acid system family protein [Chitinivorax sp. B]|uniref:polyhydroxyalkanoic acid system family protein n=1 Tax=Chitinivorax sp. B TaxID=2502235 RepID=UPI0010F7B0FD|nr:polyhydroxyalkanoic acid system family protein [Chitinivorax sp. B]